MTQLARDVFGSGSPNLQSAVGKLDNIDKLLRPKNGQPKVAEAQAHARELIDFVGKKMYSFSASGRTQVPAFLLAIECFAGLSHDAALVTPEDPARTLLNSTGQAGVQLPAHAVSEPTIITITMLDPLSPSPLVTELDKYPSYVDITQSSSVTNSLTGEVVVAVCPATDVPAEVLTRLRLGHQSATAGFQITKSASGAFLNCAGASGVASAGSRLPGWVRRLASLVMPRPLYAKMRFGGGVGGTAGEFSPFGPIDPVLGFSGGVGGTAGEFMMAPEPGGATSSQSSMPPGVSPNSRTMNSSVEGVKLTLPATCAAIPVNTEVPKECRPQVELKTYKQHPLKGVPIAWAISTGGGQVATDNAANVVPDCGKYAATASSTTNANGRAQACWILGAKSRDNTVIATPSAGGDAPVGVTFTPAEYPISITAARIEAHISLGGTSQVYDGTVKGVTITSDPADLATTVSVTYNGSSAKPTNAGSYAVVATLDAENYVGSASGTLEIAPAPVTMAAGSYSGTYDGTAHPVSGCKVSGAYTGALTCTNSKTTATNVADNGDVLPTIEYGVELPANFAVTLPGTKGTIAIAPAPVTMAAGGYSGTYDGTAHPVSGCKVSGAYTGVLTCTNDKSSAKDVKDNGDVVPAIVYGAELSENFAVTLPGTKGTIAIAPAVVTMAAGGYSGTYDGNAHAVTDCKVSGAYTGALTCTNSKTTATNVADNGDVVPKVVYGAELPENFAVTLPGTKGTIAITPAPVTMAAGGYSGTYDGTAHAVSGCKVSGVYTGVLTCTNSKTTATNVADNGDVVPTIVYGAELSENFAVTLPGTKGTIAITPASVSMAAGSYSGTYDGTAHAVSGCKVSGVYTGALSCTNSKTTATNVADNGDVVPTIEYGVELPANFAVTLPGTNGIITILKASSTTTITCNPASVTYNGLAQSPCTASATGAGGLNEAVTPTYADNTLAGVAKVSAAYSGDANHDGSSATATFTIQTHVSAAYVSATQQAIAEGIKINRTLPIHVEVHPANGGSLSNLTFTLRIDSPTAVTVPSTLFTWDPLTSTYLWNRWDVAATGGVVNGTYRLTITFDDGTTLEGFVKVTK